MSPNVLITGAAGYIGGSILADFVSSKDGPISRANVVACARSTVQVDSLAKLGVQAVVVDLSDLTAVSQLISQHEIDVVLHIANSSDPVVASNLIGALGDLGKRTKRNTCLIHTSGTTAFAPEAGWPAGKMADTEDVYEAEKRIAANHSIRMTDMAVIEEGEKHGVTTFIAVVSSVYGRGTGPCKRLSIGVPAFVRASIKDKRVHRFDKNGNAGAVHITDLAAFYKLLVEHILDDAKIPSGREGYYFAVAHTISSWALMQGLADRLYARGLIEEAQPQEWVSDEAAAASIGAPVPIVRVMGTHNTELVAKKPYDLLGWMPYWTEEAFLENLDTEIEALLEADGLSHP